MVSVFVIVSNFSINRVGKVGPSSHSSVSIPETSAASHTDQGKEAQSINHKANKVQNTQLIELLFVIIIIIFIIIIIIIIINSCVHIIKGWSQNCYRYLTPSGICHYQHSLPKLVDFCYLSSTEQ